LRSDSGWLLAMLGVLAASAAHGGDVVPPVELVGDTIPRPLTGNAGDPVRGRAIVVDRQRGLCLLCHTGPFPEERFQGTLAPDLRGAGARWSEGQLRLRMVDSNRVSPNSIMPAYYRTDHLKQVARAWEGRTVLTAEEIEDVVSFLTTLKD
ncbi:MAG TPA: sulfur oxidation c-type cytochrome SoxX, partial [Alphaproteobacteria bacterium]|nr:sulfur oxidation c-type cytochrome SoxX [Alphaproteobacteria bacterium]